MSLDLYNVTDVYIEDGVDSTNVVDRSDPMVIVFTVIGLAGCPGNLMVLWVVLMSEKMRRKPFNILIAHQAVIDLMACLSVVLTQFYKSLDDVNRPGSVAEEIYCRLWLVLSVMWVFISTSVNNLIVMTVERYLAVAKPLSYDEVTVRRRLPWFFLLCWIFGMITQAPAYILASIEDRQCLSLFYEARVTGMIVFVFWMFVFLLIPASLMIFFYYRMFRQIGQQFGGSGDSSETENVASVKRTENMRKAQINVVQTCAILCFAYICFYTFFFVTDALVIFEVLGFSNDLWNSSLISLLLNSCVNPFVYTIRYQEFQQELRRMLKFS